MRFPKWLTFLPAVLFMAVCVHGQDVPYNYDPGIHFAADTVTLKNGQVIKGTYLGGSPRGVKIEADNQIQTLDVAEIVRIEFDAARERHDLETSPTAGAIELPAGTNLVIRMIDGVDSERNSVGQTFAASLDEPVVINGETVIPRGADVVVKLVDATESGKLTGRSTLTVDLMSLKVNGRMVEVNTETVTEQSSSRAPPRWLEAPQLWARLSGPSPAAVKGPPSAWEPAPRQASERKS